MSAFDILDKMVMDGNGYLCTADVLKNGVSKPTLSDYVGKRGMERVAHGVYLSEAAWVDDLYLLHLLNRSIVFSHETALMLHGLTEREPLFTSVTVKTGYNATHLKKRGLRVYYTKPEIANLGAEYIQTSYGNTVLVYDMERTLCDILRYKDKMDIQVFQYAVKEYMANGQKNLNRLMAYAKIFKIESLVRTYTEVLV